MMLQFLRYCEAPIWCFLVFFLSIFYLSFYLDCWNGLYISSTFLVLPTTRRTLQQKSAFTHMVAEGGLSPPAHHEKKTWIEEPLGTNWGSLSCPRTLRRASRGSKDWTADLTINGRPTRPPEPLAPRVWCSCDSLSVLLTVQRVNFQWLPHDSQQDSCSLPVPGKMVTFTV